MLTTEQHERIRFELKTKHTGLRKAIATQIKNIRYDLRKQGFSTVKHKVKPHLDVRGNRMQRTGERGFANTEMLGFAMRLYSVSSGKWSK